MRLLVKTIAILAVAHMTALVGLLGFLILTGRLTPAKVNAMAAAWRGDVVPADEAVAKAPPPNVSKEPVGPPAPATAEDRLADLRERQELWRHVVARELREVEDRKQLAELIRLDVVRRHEQLVKEQQIFDEEQAALREQKNLSGFTKELEALEAAKPKPRKIALMAKKDADALQLLMQMETRSVKQIIEACKTEEELAWINRLLDRMHRLDGSTDENGAAEQAGEPNKSTETPT